MAKFIRGTEVVSDGLSLLAELYPDATIAVNADEASDWSLIGDDLGEAMEEVADELVEA